MARIGPWAAALLLLAAAPSRAVAEDRSARSVVIFSSDEHEARVTAVSQAVTFWHAPRRPRVAAPFLDPET